jgi:hypothetical protein
MLRTLQAVSIIDWAWASGFFDEPFKARIFMGLQFKPFNSISSLPQGSFMITQLIRHGKAATLYLVSIFYIQG